MSASKKQTPKHGSGHQHPAELRERAVRMVQETMKETGERHGVVTRIAVQLGLGSETLRHWVKQAEIDNGQRPGVTTKDQQRIAELEKENRELRRANEILKAASAFFARELDPRLPKKWVSSTNTGKGSGSSRSATRC